ncbi:MAG: hypothetical protein WAN50_00770 [Minisyncoccia bacterium]
MTFAQFVTSVVSVLSTVVVPVIFALAFAAFIWGLQDYFFLHGNDEKARASGRQFALWGILGLVVLLSVWGLVNMLLSTLGIAPAQ